MPRFADVRGNATTAAHRRVVTQLDGAVDAYLGARLDTRDRLDAVRASDPGCAMAWCLDGYLRMLSGKRDAIQQARDVVLDARSAALSTHVTRREALHIGALDAWSQGDMAEAVDHWDSLLAEYPSDVVAIRVSQYVLSYLGESQRMRDTVERVLPSWESTMPGYGFMLGCYAYALEESSEYARAEAMGRRAVEHNPSDIWAAHAVAHVAEMQGRLHDGIEWIGSLADNWRECTNFTFHLRWHQALLHYDVAQYDSVLALYDGEVRRQSTDETLDVTNAVSLLWRLEQADVDVGSRWRELADCARGHISDHALVFADLHYLMALAAVADADGVQRFVESCERFAASDTGTEAAVMVQIGLPLARAVVAHRRGAYGDVVDTLAPIRQYFRWIGGSRAQRDLFDQLLIDSARRGRRLDVAEALLSERLALRPRNRWGWRQHAAVLDALGSSRASDAYRTGDV